VEVHDFYTYQILQGDQINEDEMGEECGAQGRGKKFVWFWKQNWRTEATLKTKA